MNQKMSTDDNTGRWPPKQNEMPDLSAFNRKLILGVTLNVFFRRGGPRDYHAQALWKNYIRLADQLVWEYTSAREALQEFVDTPPNTLSPLFRCIAHMETCINTMRRAILYARRMRRHQASPQIDKLKVLSGDAGDRLIDLRNAIEHLESSILKGEISQGEPTTLMVQSDRVELANITIYYSELSEWAIELHSLAEELVDYQEPENT